MAISGRVPLLLLLGVVPVVLRPGMGTVWLWVLAVGLLVAVDVLARPVAAAPRVWSGRRSARSGSATRPRPGCW